MKQKFKIPIVSIILFYALVPHVYASVINLSTSVVVKKEKLKVAVEVIIENSGDEVAKRVEVSATIGEEKLTFPIQDILPGQKQSFLGEKELVALQKVALLPGEYPMKVFFSYTDSGQMHYTHAAYGMLRTAELPPADFVSIAVDSVSLSDEKNFDVELTNTSPGEREFVVTLHTAPEIVVKPETLRVLLNAGEAKKLSFSLKNTELGNGVVTSAFVFVESEKDAIHRALVKDAAIIINANFGPGVSPVQKRNTTVMAIVSGGSLLLIGLALTFVFYRREKKE